MRTLHVNVFIQNWNIPIGVNGNMIIHKTIKGNRKENNPAVTQNTVRLEMRLKGIEKKITQL